MRKTIFLPLALAAFTTGCGSTPTDPGVRAPAPSTIQADGIEVDSDAARGGTGWAWGTDPANRA